MSSQDVKKNELTTVRHKAAALLARRDHSIQELFTKLKKYEFSVEAINETIAFLLEQDLLNDARFTEMYVRSRIHRGMGPVRIIKELRERGVSDYLINEELALRTDDWFDLLESVRFKKYGRQMPEEYKEKMRQARFLEYRGFPPNLIRELMF